ncbi:hypothetical protein IV203_002024 [Nitzschia inconspicua]|uniref:Uncharacterized protein n=1 Tax=Nitzschia inconspicua TaxID=303405 RepID=A0A9K3L9M1_9STRA|nr:hypothetical protein IV203_002024 [Nitzschia inconspicua]
MTESREVLACSVAVNHDNYSTGSDSGCDCCCGPIVVRLVCILGYNGIVRDIIINYTLILINLSYCIWEMKRNGDSHARNSSEKRQQELRAMGALTFVVFFQFILCLAVGCTGVSIIWCAICGWIMSRHKRLVDSRSDELQEYRSLQPDLLESLEKTEKTVVMLDVVAIGYYAVMLPFITTVAHICALILGAILFSLSFSMKISRDGRSTPLPNEPLLPSPSRQEEGNEDEVDERINDSQ